MKRRCTWCLGRRQVQLARRAVRRDGVQNCTLAATKTYSGSARAAEILLCADRSAGRYIRAQAIVRYLLHVQAMRAGGALIFENSSSEKVN